MIEPGEELITCPYNKAHAIRRAQMQFHLSKCRKNYPDMEKATCPFNSTHHVNKVELENHIENCTDRGVLDNFVYRVSSRDPPAGLLPVQTFNIGGGDGDDWDAPGSNVPNVLTQVANIAQSKGVLISKIGAPKSERKAHRFNERLRHAYLSTGSSDGHSQLQASSSPTGPTLPPQPPAPVPKEPKMNCAAPPDMPEPKFVHPTTESFDVQSAAPPTSAWSGGRPNALKVNAHDFPSLGSKGNPRRDNDSALQDQMSNMSLLDSDRNERPNAWGRPAPRQQDARISVPASGLSGANRSHSNPWGSRPQPSRPADPAASPMPSVTAEDFPTLMPMALPSGGSGRGRRSKH